MASSDADPRVVFVVGCGRSGTTLVYELLAVHPDTAWISTWTDRLGLPRLAALNGLFARSGRSGRFFPPRPSEGYRTWDRAFAPNAAREGVVDGADLTDAERAAMWSFARRHCAATDSPVFLNKNTRNSRRVELLNSVFPEASFVHVRRDPFDTVSSLLRVHWWPDLPLWFIDGRSPRQVCDTPVAEAMLAAELYRRELDAIGDARAVIHASRWIEVEYERMALDPRGSLESLLADLELPPSPLPLERLGGVRRGSVGIHERTLGDDQREAIEAVLG